MVNSKNKVLLIYIEPTPYIIGLIKNIISILKDRVDVIFLKENASQSWNIELDKKWMLLSNSRIQNLVFIWKLFATNRYNLVHVAGWNEPIFWWVLLLSKLQSIPVSVESDTPAPFYIKKWKHYTKCLLYPRLFKRINLFLPGGKRQAKYIESFGVKNDRIFPVQMTVDVSAIQKYVIKLSQNDLRRIKQAYQIPEQQFVYLYVGRLEEHKGIIDLIAAFQALKNPHISLLIIGDGTLRQMIESAAQVDRRIVYGGRLSEYALVEAYFAADVVILPSHFEPWGLVVNEAMAAGKPVIVSDRVGCIDDLVSVDNGIIVQAADIQELSSAMEWIMTCTQHQRMTMSEHSKRKIASWTLENAADNMCKAWQQAGFINL